MWTLPLRDTDIKRRAGIVAYSRRLREKRIVLRQPLLAGSQRETTVTNGKRNRCDLQPLQSSDEGDQGTHLPREEKVEVSEVRPSKDAKSEVKSRASEPAVAANQ